MEPKDYQQKVIERFETYLQVLADQRENAEIVFGALKKAGKDPEPQNFCKDAWQELNNQRLLPLVRDKKGNAHVADYINRFDGLDRPIPSVCFKVPTAGGKTLLATAALERITVDYFRQQTGFVLWIVPSDAIYRQTWKNLANREHPYRQMLERASGGRVRLLERWDPFTPHDVKDHLCVMLLMLQAAGRKSKETLRMFRDSGRFTGFFPPVDDYTANNAILNDIRNLDTNDLGDGDEGVIKGVSVKHSLGNTLRLIRPIVVIDEGHRAYSETARDTLCGFNPSFVLELSATPNAKKRLSNVLVDIPGTALKDEQMIKLPIVLTDKPTDWKATLTEAHAQLMDLQKDADKLQEAEGRYIRPIMLIRVDRTGKEQRDGVHVHAEDAREFLTDNLGVNAGETRVKSAFVDEIGDEDLLSEFSSARYIITKDALREGWDCPFAYVLVVLSKMTATTAMTQMIGRVLRQPEATATGVERLNQCYVFCFDQDVSQAIESIKVGLEEEGMGDLALILFT